jgi:hypothetical protein
MNNVYPSMTILYIIKRILYLKFKNSTELDFDLIYDHYSANEGTVYTVHCKKYHMFIMYIFKMTISFLQKIYLWNS